MPGAIATTPLGINGRGQIVGTSLIGTINHGFLYEDGVFTTIDVPGATRTFVRAINARGQIVGFFDDDGGRHGFLLDKGTFTTIGGPGASSSATLLFSINARSQILGISSLNFLLEKGHI